MTFDQIPAWKQQLPRTENERNQEMDRAKIENLGERLKEQGKMRFRDGATEEEILQFEKEHGVTLPNGFKAWLQYSDGGEFFLPAGVYFRGVAHKPLINVDHFDRPDENFIVIGATCTGEPIVFEKGKEEISIYDHETGRIEEEERFSDVFTFLNSLYDYLGIGE